MNENRRCDNTCLSTFVSIPFTLLFIRLTKPDYIISICIKKQRLSTKMVGKSIENYMFICSTKIKAISQTHVVERSKYGNAAVHEVFYKRNLVFLLLSILF